MNVVLFKTSKLQLAQLVTKSMEALLATHLVLLIHMLMSIIIVMIKTALTICAQYAMQVHLLLFKVIVHPV